MNWRGLRLWGGAKAAAIPVPAVSGPSNSGASLPVPIDPARLLDDTRDYCGYMHGQIRDRARDLASVLDRHDEALGLAKAWMGDEALRRVCGQAKDGCEASYGHLLQAIEGIEGATRAILDVTYNRYLESGYKVFPIHADGRADRRADVVFVHGLDGHAFTTWCHDDRRRHESWPHWLAREFPDVGVWSLGYAADKSHWGGQGLALPVIAQAVIDALEDVVGRRPLILVVHSLGGLVAKRAMRDAWAFQAYPGYEGHRAFREALRAIVFLASPHHGAAIATVAESISLIFRSTAVLESLRANDPETLALDDWFRNEAGRLLTAKELEVLAYRETEPFKKIMVVNAASANPGIPGVPARSVPGKNHSTICKCEDTDDPIYKDVRALIQRIIVPAAPPPP